MTIKIGISPCPNDTFIFDALYAKKINTDNIHFEFILEDVEKLNQMALHQELDVVKISYAHFFNVSKNYQLLQSGGALGKGVGPLLITNEANKILTNHSSIAIPGVHTTANFLLTFYNPLLNNKMPMLFSNIENAVLKNEVEAGVIIHENRFTYASKGLHQIIDLGTYWETKTHLPIPLGGIAIKRNIDDVLKIKMNTWIQQSLRMSWDQYPTLSPFVKQHAQEMNEETMKQHINLYVNEESLQISEQGMEAVMKMKEIICPTLKEDIFI